MTPDDAQRLEKIKEVLRQPSVDIYDRLYPIGDVEWLIYKVEHLEHRLARREAMKHELDF